MRAQLNRLAAEFDRLARPADGQYVRVPARPDANGVLRAPPPAFPTAAVLMAVGAGAAVGALTAGERR
jgi:hypothetical protein